MYIGIDFGMSGVKVTLPNERGDVVASKTEKLTVSRPRPLWLEQDLEQWWLATDRAVKILGQQHSLREVKALGVAGQMYGATLLDEQQKVLRPAILRNDSRYVEECEVLESQVPQSRTIIGNLVMSGSIVPKLLWVQRHEPEIFNQADKVLLPKDYLRSRTTGDFVNDMSDAVGTTWLDVAKRGWSDIMLVARKLTCVHISTFYEDNEITRVLLPDIAKAQGMQEAIAAIGGGDNAAGTVGVDTMSANQAIPSLGVSGIYFAVSDGFLSKPESAVRSFCHTLPERRHLISVMLSVVSCLDWTARLIGLASVPALTDIAQQTDEYAEPVWFSSCLFGGCTPHNNPQAKGVFFGLTHQHGPAELTQAMLEGVGFALADGMDVVHACGVRPASITLIGGGARSEYWRQMLFGISGLQLDYRTDGDVGSTLSATRPAQTAMNPQTSLSGLLPQLTLEQAHYLDAECHARYQRRQGTFRRIYQQLQPLMFWPLSPLASRGESAAYIYLQK